MTNTIEVFPYDSVEVIAEVPGTGVIIIPDEPVDVIQETIEPAEIIPGEPVDIIHETNEPVVIIPNEPVEVIQDTTTQPAVIVPAGIVGPVGPVGPIGPVGIGLPGPIGQTGPAGGVFFETRGTAAASTIPVAFLSIEIRRFATGYPIAPAMYKPGTISGPMAFQEAAGHYWELDFTGGSVRAEWFGCIGDGATDNFSPLTAAINYCVNNNKTLQIYDGTYWHNGKLVWGYEKLKVHAMGSKVILRHTASGVGHEFSGMTLYPGSQGAAGGVFGGPNIFLLEGTGSTTNLVLIDNWHFGDMRIAPKNASNALVFFQNTGIVNASAVESTFEINVSANYSGAFTTTPLYGIRATSVVACTFNKTIVEICGNVSSATPGISLVGCIGNLWNGGTVESCVAGGISLNFACNRNIFNSMHCEANGTQQDWIIAGNNNIFIGCAGGATTSGQFISGDYNQFIGGTYQSIAVQTGGIGNTFRNLELLTAFTDAGSETSVIGCTGVVFTQQDYAAANLGNKHFNTADANTFFINSKSVTDLSGTGTILPTTVSPTITTPVFSGTITGTYTLGGTYTLSGATINGVTINTSFAGSAVLPVSMGGTADTGTAWTLATTTWTATTGTGTANNRYKIIGKTVFIRIGILLTSAVTGTMAIALPAPCLQSLSLSGTNLANGKSVVGFANAGTSSLFVLYGDGTQILNINDNPIITGVYEST